METNDTTLVYGDFEVNSIDDDTIEVKDTENNKTYTLVNREIEKKQYSFSIEVPDSGILQSNFLTVYGKSGRIHLSRLGLINNNKMKDAFAWPPKEGPEALFPDDVPQLEGYSYCRKPLRDGYVYVYDEYASGETDNVYHEYEINGGKLYKILWTKDNMGDVRTAGTKEMTDFHLIPSQAIYVYLAYSEVQWPVKYVAKMMDTDSEEAKEFRKKRFIRVRVNDWEEACKDSSFKFPPQVVPAKEVQIIQEKDTDPADPTYRAMNAFTLFHTVDMSPDEKPTERTPTMYLTLHDPLGAADDLRKENIDLLEELSSLLQEVIYSKEFAEQEDYPFLFQQAVSLYHTFHNDEATDEGIKKLKEYLAKKEFFEKILLIKERKQLREEINKGREQLFRFVDSDYYRQVINDFTENIPTRLEQGIAHITDHHKGVAWDPCLMDQSIDGTTVPAYIQKEIDVYMLSIYDDEEHPVSRLFSTRYTFEDYLFAEQEEYASSDEAVQKTDFIWSNLTNIALLWNEYAQQRPVPIEEMQKHNPAEPVHPLEYFRPPAPPKEENLPKPVRPSGNVEPAIKIEPQKVPQVDIPKKTTPTNSHAANVKVIDTHPSGSILLQKEGKMYIGIPDKWVNKFDAKRNVTGPRGGKKQISIWVYEIQKKQQVLKDMGLKQVEKAYGPGIKGFSAIQTKRIPGLAAHLIGSSKNYAIIEVVPVKGSHVGTATSNANNLQNISFKANNTQMFDIMAKVFTSKLFLGFSSLLSAGNFAVVYNNADFENNPNSSRAEIAAAATEMLQFIFEFTYKFYPTTNTFIGGFIKAGRSVAGVASWGALGIVNLMKGWNALQDKNYKQSLAYAGSGTFLLGVMAIEIAKKSQWKWFARGIKNPNKWAIAFILLSVGLSYWAEKLRRTPLENYLANCILNKDAEKYIKNWQSTDGLSVIKKLYKEKENIISNNYVHFRNMEVSFNTYNDLLTYTYPDVQYSIKKKSGKYREMKFETLTVYCNFPWLYYDTDVDFGLRFYFWMNSNPKALFYRDIPGIYEETERGCKITYDRSVIEAKIPSYMNVEVGYFYHRCKYRDDTCEPVQQKDGQEQDVYHMDMIFYDYVYIHHKDLEFNGDVAKIKSKRAQAVKENRVPLTFKEVESFFLKDKKGLKFFSMNKDY